MSVKMVDNTSLLGSLVNIHPYSPPIWWIIVNFFSIFSFFLGGGGGEEGDLNLLEMYKNNTEY